MSNPHPDDGKPNKQIVIDKKLYHYLCTESRSFETVCATIRRLLGLPPSELRRGKRPSKKRKAVLV